jgi:NAD(P)H dehydrogenase (quinone)
MTGPRVAVVGGNGKTGVAVCAALAARGADAVPLGRAEWDHLGGEMEGCVAAYLIAPNFHPDEPGFVAHVLKVAAAAGVGRVVYHSVASPYVPAMPHHLGKAVSEDVVRTSGLRWTILQPGAYVENLDLTATVYLPYRADAEFGFAALDDVGRAAAEVLLDADHHGATYELASRLATVADLAAEAGVDVVVESADEWFARYQVPPGRVREGLAAMYAYYDAHGLPVGEVPLRALLDREGSAR